MPQQTAHFAPPLRPPSTFALCLVATLSVACAERTETVELPADVSAGTALPEPFLPGIADPGGPVKSLAFSPEGQSIFLVRTVGGRERLELTRWTEQGFTPPVTLPFAEPGMDADPHLSLDGRWLYFASLRPYPEGAGGSPAVYNLWRVSRSPEGWGIPEPVPGVNRLDSHDRAPALSGDGQLLFASHRGGGSDLFLAQPSGSGFAPPVSLGPGVNTDAWEGDPYLAPDASFVVFTRREAVSGGVGASPEVSSGNWGSGNLFLSTWDGQGWGGPEPLSGGVNTLEDEFAPFISPGGEYLFFNRGSAAVWWAPTRAAGIPLE